METYYVNRLLSDGESCQLAIKFVRAGYDATIICYGAGTIIEISRSK